MDAFHLFWFWAMPSTRSDGMASSSSGTPESVVAPFWNQWTAYTALVDEFFGIRTGGGGQVQVRHGCRRGDVEHVNAIRERVGRELVWLGVHKDPVVFSRETVLSPSNDPVSRLWNYDTGQFRAWERVPQPPRRTGKCLATLHRPERKRRIEGRLSPLNEKKKNRENVCIRPHEGFIQ